MPNPALTKRILEATREIIRVYPTDNSERAVGRILNDIGTQYGRLGLLSICTAIVMAATPPDILDLAPQDRMMVHPISLIPVDNPDYHTMTAVMQFIAAVLADDAEMAQALFNANVTSINDHSANYLSLIISTACNTIYADDADEDGEDGDVEIHLYEVP